jgi:hypothetical protein
MRDGGNEGLNSVANFALSKKGLNSVANTKMRRKKKGMKKEERILVL